MGKVIVSENVTLDGVVQDPTSDEDFTRGGWGGAGPVKGDVAKVVLDDAVGTEALLLGRRSYEFFAARWPSRSGVLADRLNGKAKYVVSSTLRDPAWNNTTVLDGDLVAEVSKLKEQVAGDINVAGSGKLVHALMEHDLVDELRLIVYPVVLGDGDRLFGETSGTRPMRLIRAETIGDGLAFLTYERLRP